MFMRATLGFEQDVMREGLSLKPGFVEAYILTHEQPMTCFIEQKMVLTRASEG